MFKALARFFGFLSRPPAPPAPHSPRPSPSPNPAPAAPPRPTAPQPLDRSASPESLCGLTPHMSPEDFRSQLAKLYQRHNRAASSLDPILRDDAEFMLETIACLREKYPPAPPPDASLPPA